MFRRSIILIILLTQSISALYSQIRSDFYLGKSLDGLVFDYNFHVKVSSDISITPSFGLYTNGISSDPLIRTGITKILNTRSFRENLISFGIQVSGIASQIRLTKKYELTFLRYDPYIRMRTPILRVPKECYCGSQKGYLIELVADFNSLYSSLGIGIRK